MAEESVKAINEQNLDNVGDRQVGGENIKELSPIDQRISNSEEITALLGEFSFELFNEIEFEGKPIGDVPEIQPSANKAEAIAIKLSVEKEVEKEKDSPPKPIQINGDLNAQKVENSIKKDLDVNKSQLECDKEFLLNPDAFSPVVIPDPLDVQPKEVVVHNQIPDNIPIDRQAYVNLNNGRIIPRTEKGQELINQGNYKLALSPDVKDERLKEKVAKLNEKPRPLFATFVGEKFWVSVSRMVQERIDQKIASSKEDKKSDKSEESKKTSSSIYSSRTLREINRIVEAVNKFDREMKEVIQKGPSGADLAKMMARLFIIISVGKNLEESHKERDIAEKVKTYREITEDYLKYLDQKRHVNDQELKHQQHDILTQHSLFIQNALTIWEIRDKGVPAASVGG
jgi:hypothetical protein